MTENSKWDKFFMVKSFLDLNFMNKFVFMQNQNLSFEVTRLCMDLYYICKVNAKLIFFDGDVWNYFQLLNFE
jgi:hypothetical protein